VAVVVVVGKALVVVAEVGVGEDSEVLAEAEAAAADLAVVPEAATVASAGMVVGTAAESEVEAETDWAVGVEGMASTTAPMFVEHPSRRTIQLSKTVD